ncbi:MAG TPA: UDP-N-acetylmuramoyl-L-alanine--D-glutamate ligase [Burkholderiaceae bacterium]|nr:UDP-N-acetylmuramoyl-L-alanine--D-glutamate ligase [Burkholderiaceae bacterium]
MKDLQGITVLVLGLGDSGLAMARWCARHGAAVRVWDSREPPPQAAALREAVQDAVLLTGALDVSAVEGVARVLKSPGLAPSDPRIAPVIEEARRRGVPVQGELDLFAQALVALKAQHRYDPAVLAITGTNGKTTTASLTALLVERAGKRVALAGNIGPTMLDTLARALDEEPWETQAAEGGLEPAEDVPVADAAVEGAGADDSQTAGGQDAGGAGGPDADGKTGMLAGDESGAGSSSSTEDPAVEDAGAPDEDAAPVVLPPPPPAAPTFQVLPEVWVLELSSFQLDAVQGFEPSAAVVLNLSQDHLDWHGSMEAYVAAKARVYGREGVMVVPRGESLIEAMVPPPVPGKGRFARPIERRVVRFGLDAPQRPGDFGLIAENGMAWLARAMEADETLRVGRTRKREDEDEELHIQRLMPADALRIRGRHNAANALAALALASAIGCPLAPMLHGLREYRGEPHRVESVAIVDGVEYFDDSKGTNVGATVAALHGLGEERAPGRLAVILGGDGKGQDFSPLADPVSRYVRYVALIGRDAEAIGRALAATGVTMERHETLQAAVRACAGHAQAGDAVLLSPACASLDMFRNYGHRAEVFVAEVRAIATDRGEILT